MLQFLSIASGCLGERLGRGIGWDAAVQIGSPKSEGDLSLIGKVEPEVALLHVAWRSDDNKSVSNQTGLEQSFRVPGNHHVGFRILRRKPHSSIHLTVRDDD